MVMRYVNDKATPQGLRQLGQMVAICLMRDLDLNPRFVRPERVGILNLLEVTIRVSHDCDGGIRE